MHHISHPSGSCIHDVANSVSLKPMLAWGSRSLIIDCSLDKPMKIGTAGGNKG